MAIAALADKPAGDTAGLMMGKLRAARREARLSPLERRAALDATALARARRAAAEPQRGRLAAGGSIADALRAAGALRFSRAAEYVGLERGHADPASALYADWRDYAGGWAHAVDPDYDAVGLAQVTARDGWTVFVAVFVEDPAIPEDPRALERETVHAINTVRQRHGLSSLTENPELTRVARSHSEDMTRRGYFAHVAPDGSGLVDRIRRSGIAYGRVAENIQANLGVTDQVTQAVDSWLASEGHRQNILTPEFQETGVGVSIADDGAVYFTQVFLTRPEPPGER